MFSYILSWDQGSSPAPVGGVFIVWYIDSGAGKPITGDQSLFSVYTPLPYPLYVKFGDGVLKQALGSGSIVLGGPDLRSAITLTDVLYIPDCPVNLISVHAIATSLDCTVHFTSEYCTATRDSETIWSVPASSTGVFHFDAFVCPPDATPAFSCTQVLGAGIPSASREASLWHRRLGHPGYSSYQRLVSSQMVDGLPVSPDQVRSLHKVPCHACNIAKAVRVPFPATTRYATAPLERLHLDTMGPFPIRGLRGEFHVLVLTDEHSGYGAAVPITSKGRSSYIVQRLILQWTSILTGMVFRYLRSDRAKEFMVGWFEAWLVSMGGQHEFSCSYSPQQNGTAERYNGTIQNIARSLLLESKLASSFWPYAFSCASYLRNMLPTSGGATPHTLFFGIKPDVSLLRVFGATCYATLVNGKKRGKLGPRAVEGRFLGYSVMSRGYIVWLVD